MMTGNRPGVVNAGFNYRLTMSFPRRGGSDDADRKDGDDEEKQGSFFKIFHDRPPLIDGFQPSVQLLLHRHPAVLSWSVYRS